MAKVKDDEGTGVPVRADGSEEMEAENVLLLGGAALQLQPGEERH